MTGLAVFVTMPTRLVTVVTIIVTSCLQLVNSVLSMALNRWSCTIILEEGTSVGQSPNPPGQQQQSSWPGNNDNLVAFRIKPEQLSLFRRPADHLCQNGFIPEPTL